jgi:hypothetical protein
MGVRLENLKMIVCRARKKLLRSMAERLSGSAGAADRSVAENESEAGDAS